ncbi:hypothetical protein LJC48_03385 [Desulfovibrio sp. OttesenSCG-928-C06]|nr:hypothetical protein [Desulfovibrio sp. OttesenSCG-928-C06]
MSEQLNPAGQGGAYSAAAFPVSAKPKPHGLAVVLLILHAILGIAALVLSLWCMSAGGYAVLLLFATVPVLVVSGLCCIEGVRGRGIAGIIGSGIGTVLSIVSIVAAGSDAAPLTVFLLAYGGSFVGYMYLRQLRTEAAKAQARRILEQAGVSVQYGQNGQDCQSGQTGYDAQPGQFSQSSQLGPSNQSCQSGQSGQTGQNGPGGIPDAASATPQTEIERLLAASRKELSGASSISSTVSTGKAPLGILLFAALCVISFALPLLRITHVASMGYVNLLFYLASLALPLLMLYFTYVRKRQAVLTLLVIDVLRRGYFLVSLLVDIAPYLNDAGFQLVFFMLRSVCFCGAAIVFLVYMFNSQGADAYFGPLRRAGE